jgi:PAS domain S-box-containing protein
MRRASPVPEAAEDAGGDEPGRPERASRQGPDALLRETDARHRILLERLPAIVYRAGFGADGPWTYVSPQIESLLGFSPEEWMADPELFYRQLHPEDRDRYLAAELRSQETGEPLVCEYRLMARDGTVRCFRDEATVASETESGRPLLYGVMLDVTRAREAEEARREGDRRMRAMFQSSAVGMCVVDMEGRVLETNGVFDEMLGYEPEELLGRPFSEFTLPEDLPQNLRLFRQMAAGQLERYRFEKRYRRKDGEIVWVNLSASLVRDADSEPQFCIAMVENTTERKRAEEALGQSEERYRQLFERATDIIFTRDLEGTLTSVNPAVEDVLGFRPEEMVGRKFSEFLSPDSADVPRRAVQRAIEERQDTITYEVAAVGRDGREVRLEVNSRIIDDDGAIRLEGVARDVTERKRVEEQVRAAQQDLRESFDLLRTADEQRRHLMARLVEAQEEERQRIAADIHDDSIQIMAAVAMRVVMLRRRLQDERLVEEFNELEETVELSISRLRHLLFELRPAALDREGLGAALRLHLEQTKKETGLAYSLNNRLVNEPNVEGRTILYRIAQEALANVRKHARAQLVEVQLEERDHGFLVRVRDDGRGFQGAVAEPSRPGHLGLSAMRERAEMAGGWLRIESAPGTGTTVEFWVPEDASTTGRPGPAAV